MHFEYSYAESACQDKPVGKLSVSVSCNRTSSCMAKYSGKLQENTEIELKRGGVPSKILDPPTTSYNS